MHVITGHVEFRWEIGDPNRAGPQPDDNHDFIPVHPVDD